MDACPIPSHRWHQVSSSRLHPTPTRDSIVTELAFFCQFRGFGHRNDESVLFNHHDLTTTRTSTGIHNLSSQRISRFPVDNRRLPSCPKLGRGVSYHCHPFGLWTSFLFSSVISYLILIQEFTDIVHIINFVTIPSDTTDFSCICSWDHFLNFADPFGYKVWRTKHDCRVSIQQLYHASRYCRFPSPHFRLAVGPAIFSN